MEQETVTDTPEVKPLRRSYTYLLRPTQRQERQLLAILEHHCDLYNAALQERIDAYRCRYEGGTHPVPPKGQRHPLRKPTKHLGGHANTCPCGTGREKIRLKTGVKDIGRRAQFAQLADLRQADPFISGFSSSAQRNTVERVDRAFQAFFDRGVGYPRYRSRSRFDSVEWANLGGASVLTAERPSARDKDKTRHVRVSDIVLSQVVGCIRMKSRGTRGYDPAQDVVKTIRIKRSGGRWDKTAKRWTGTTKWYVILSCEVRRRPRPVRNSRVGVDLGITELLATSDGVLVPNPKWLQQSADTISDLQRQRATKKGSRKGETRSSRFRRLNQKIAKEHHKVQNRRKYAAWTAANYLVRKYDLIAVEDLQIRNMSRSAKGSIEEPGTNVAAKSGLNRSILDAGWGGILHALDVKAECAGRVVVKAPPHNTSRTCPACGQVDAKSRSGIRFQCVSCGHTDHADVNAAKNILIRADQSLASGDSSRCVAPAHVADANGPPNGPAGGFPPILTPEAAA